jgi:hypothetical protein
MKRCFLPVLCLLALFAFVSHADQYTGPPLPDQLKSSTGTGCSYDVTAQYEQQVGCWADGTCYTVPIIAPWVANGLHVSFYQWWNCSSAGIVHASGESLETQTAIAATNWNYYSYGIAALGKAVVTFINGGFPVTTNYAAIDYQDCDGEDYYSGAYSYGC